MEPSTAEASEPKLLRSRRAAREAVVSTIYICTIRQCSSEEALEDIFEITAYAPETQAFIRETMSGIDKQLEALDEIIKPFMAQGWEYDRLAITDKCVLRLAAYELLHLPKMPPKVTINEAVSLAKKFGGEQSGKFVNGLLGKLLLTLPKKDWTGEEAEEGDTPDQAEDVATDEIEESTIQEYSDEYNEMVKAGAWSIRKREDQP